MIQCFFEKFSNLIPIIKSLCYNIFIGVIMGKGADKEELLKEFTPVWNE